MSKKNQKGVGMIEVLVSLLIIAIAVMGFVALQVRAIQASQDAVIKTQAMHFMQSITESMRINSQSKANYLTSINTYSLSTANTPPSATKKCDEELCSGAEFAMYEAYDISRQAGKFGIKLAVATCPGIATSTPNNIKRLCLFSAWDKTTFSGTIATINYSNCMTSTGSYVQSSGCLMMEAY